MHLSGDDSRTIVKPDEYSTVTDESTLPGSEYEEEDREPNHYKKMVINLFFVVSYGVVGVLSMMLGNGTDFITSLYVIAQIVTTVGYGDITMQTDNMRIFMTFYVLCGFAFAANILNDAGTALIDMESDSMRAHLITAREKRLAGHKHVPPFHERYRLYRLFISIGLFGFFALSWTVFFVLYESCSCSYGASKVADCDEGNCEKTDAQKKNWPEAFYMAVVTLTSVGFGDFTPQTYVGRALASVWMFFGVLASVNMVHAISQTINAIYRGGRLHRMNFTENIFRQMDLNDDGRVTRGEFLRFVLIRESIVTKEIVNEIDNLFDASDTDNSGTITFDDLVSYHPMG